MIIYEAINKKNGKVYIGLTTQSLEKRKGSHLRSAKAGSNMHFHKALRKYGEDGFEWNVVLICSSLKSLYDKEKLLISLEEPEMRYNKSLGGEHSAYGMKHSDQTKAICKQATEKRWEGKRVTDIYPSFVFELDSYKETKKYGIPKTTWYRNRVIKPQT
jgi:group I intron endonuclease